MNRALIAGVGNLFFGVEVARQLAGSPPTNATVTDFGIRALHFAYELLNPVSLCIVADCMPRGGDPGTLYVLEPELDGATATSIADGHGMSLPVVFSAVRELGGVVPRVLVVGCEPEMTELGVGLSPSVRRAVPAAVELIRELVITHNNEDNT